MFVHGKYFYGNEISTYGQEHGRVDYATLAKAFDSVLNNDIMERTEGVIGYWEQESGFVDNTEEIDELQEQVDELQEEIDDVEGRIEELEEEIEELTLEDADENGERIEELEGIREELIEQKENLEKQMEELEEEIDELEEEQDGMDEIFQYYIVSDNGACLLKEIGQIVFYNEELDMYVWGVTHWGTSWDYVLTNIRCNVPYENETEE